MKVVLQHLTKRFPNRNKKAGGDVIAVHDFTFEIPDGKLIGLLGPSGCGKSTALNLISGLLEPSEGQIFFGEDDVTHLPPENRGVGLVFQNYALYPHLTVRQNIMFPLENLRGAEKLTKAEMAERTLEAAKLVQLEGLMDRKPSELSGGQQQRVAIARALVKRPRVLLLDEPLSNLDARLRLQTREELRRIQRETGITTVFVTHDQDEAVEVADEIIITNHGHIEQMGTPMEIYKSPDTPFVAQFIGRSSIVEHYERLLGFDPIEGATHAVIRPEFVRMSRSEPPQHMSAAERGIVKDVIFRGNHLDVVVDVGGIPIVTERSLEKDPVEIGEKVYVLIYRLYIFDENQTYLVENREMQEGEVFYI